MSMYPLLLNGPVRVMHDIASGEKYKRTEANLEKSKYFSKEELKELQLKKTRKLLEHAYNTVPYYHRVFKGLSFKPEDLKSLGDLERLPVLTKEIIRENREDLVSTGFSGKTVHHHTGGSTGQPLEFCVSKDSLTWGGAALHRAWAWCGFKTGEKQAILWGSSFDVKKHKQLFPKIKNMAYRRVMLDCFNLTEDSLREYVDVLLRFKPRMLRGYTSPVHLISEYALSKGIDLDIPLIFTTAENIYDHQRRIIEKAFSGKVFDGYGGRETSLIAFECPAHQGYHVSLDTTRLEIVDSHNKHLENRTGKFLLTDLHNYAMPFIRYEVGDAGAWSSKECTCGVKLPMLAKLDGRLHNFIVTAENGFIPGEFFPHLMKDSVGVSDFQVVQKKAGHITLFVVPFAGYSEEFLRALLTNIERYGSLDVDIEEVEKIEVPVSGKRLFTISEVPVKFT